MSERTDADKLAERLIVEQHPHASSDDLRALASQLLRRREVIDRLEKRLAEMTDPTLDMIHANTDADLRMCREAARRVRKCLTVVAGVNPTDDAAYYAAKLGLAVLDALNQFHPMHGESWAGWPEGSE